jgi:hypothetical protein
VLDLTGYDTSTTASTVGGYNGSTTTLTITDPGHTTLEYTLAGNLSGSNWSVVEDSSSTGVDIYDPPAAPGSAASPLVESVATANGDSGTITFADTDTANTRTASVAPEGSNTIGTFSVAPINESNGNASVDWQFDLGNDQINLAPGQTVTQSYDVQVTDAQNPAQNVNQTVSVSIGGPGNDNFVFAPGVGADTIINFNPQADTIELDHFAGAQTTQQLASLITTDAHGDAVIELGDNDSITIPGVSASYLQAHLSSLVHLH